MATSSIQIIPFRPELAPAFARLNLEWIERFFTVEELDRLMLTDCEHTIIAPGGQIFFATREEDVIGTAAVVRHSAAVCELAKMAVVPSAQGQGVGRKLAGAAIAFAEARGAHKITLMTNSRLKPALHLYEGLGFTYCELPADAEYARANVY